MDDKDLVIQHWTDNGIPAELVQEYFANYSTKPDNIIIGMQWRTLTVNIDDGTTRVIKLQPLSPAVLENKEQQLLKLQTEIVKHIDTITDKEKRACFVLGIGNCIDEILDDFQNAYPSEAESSLGELNEIQQKLDTAVESEARKWGYENELYVFKRLGASYCDLMNFLLCFPKKTVKGF